MQQIQRRFSIADLLNHGGQIIRMRRSHTKRCADINATPGRNQCRVLADAVLHRFHTWSGKLIAAETISEVHARRKCAVKRAARQIARRKRGNAARVDGEYEVLKRRTYCFREKGARSYAMPKHNRLLRRALRISTDPQPPYAAAPSYIRAQ